MKRFRLKPLTIIAGVLLLVAISSIGLVTARHWQPFARFALQKALPQRPIRMTRPYGMAPEAFNAFIRACRNAHIHPLRVSQTIGDDPRSVGYHKRDGVLRVGSEKIDYTAAADIITYDLKQPQIDRFVTELGKQGFAVWYRHGPKWKNGEHIHAVYAMLPMKLQLKRQVRLYLREENPSWERKWFRSRFSA